MKWLGYQTAANISRLIFLLTVTQSRTRMICYSVQLECFCPGDFTVKVNHWFQTFSLISYSKLAQSCISAKHSFKFSHYFPCTFSIFAEHLKIRIRCTVNNCLTTQYPKQLLNKNQYSSNNSILNKEFRKIKKTINQSENNLQKNIK